MRKMANLLSLPVELREVILNKLSNEDLLRIRRVSQELLLLANHILNRRHQQLWSWSPHFPFSDQDDWVHSKMAKGIICGGLPACCIRHNFERIRFTSLLSKSLVIWIEEDACIKLGQVLAPLLATNGATLTSFTLSLDECAARSIPLNDITALFTHLPNLRNFGFRCCRCSIRPKGHPYETRRSQFPPLPHLEVLDLEWNENVILTNGLLEAYGNQIKGLILPAFLLDGSAYLNGPSPPLVFEQLRDLKITNIRGEYQRRISFTTPRLKLAGRKLFKMLASLPLASWRLERLSLNIDDWAIHRSDRWALAILELLQLMERFSQTIKELYIHFEFVDKSMDFSTWMSSTGIRVEEQNNAIISSRYIPPTCPNLKKVSVDSVLMETPLLLHILKCFGSVEQLEFLNWCHYDSRWSDRYELARIPGNMRPVAGDLPQMVSGLWKGLPSLRKITVFGTNEGDPYYMSERGIRVW